MSINPQLLMMNSSSHQVEEVEEQEAGADGDFEVERILDYDLMDAELLGCAPEEWEPQGLKYEVRYLVKWKGYDNPSDNTWEPRRNFGAWHPEYNKTLKRLRKEKGLKRVSVLEEEATEKNRRWKKQLKEAKAAEAKRLTGAALLTGRKKKKGEKSKEKVQEKEKVKKKDKGKGKEKESLAQESASSAPSASSSLFQPAARRTRTSRADDLWDDAALEDMARHGNLPPELQKLRRTPPPKHDANGNLIQSSSEAGSLSPQLERAPLSATSYEQYPTYQTFQLPPDDGGFDPYAQAQTSFESFSVAGQQQYGQQSYAMSAQPAQHEQMGLGGGGFAESSDGEEEGLSRDLGGFEQTFDHPMEDVSVLGGPSADGGSVVGGSVVNVAPAESGWAGESDEEDDEQPQQANPAAQVPAHRFDVVVDQSSSVAGGELDTKDEVADQGGEAAFAASESEDGDEKAARAAPEPVPAAVAGSSVGQEPAAGPSQRGETVSALPAAEGGEAGFASGDSDEDDVMNDLFAGDDDTDDEANAPLTVPQQAPKIASTQPKPFHHESRPSSRAPARQPSKPPSRPASRPSSQPPPSRYSRESASPQLVTIRQGSPPRKKQDRGEGKKERDGEKEKGRTAAMPAPPKPSSKTSSSTAKVVQVKASASKGNVKSSRPPPAPASLQENRALPPPQKKAKRVVESDEDDDAAPTLKQAMSGMGKIGKKTAASRTSLDTAATVAVSSPPSADSASAGKSSFSSALKTRQEYDPWNQGVERPTSKDGFVVINNHFLANQKLAEKLNRSNRVKFPPNLVSPVEKVRFYWQLGNNPLDGMDDFDAVLLNDGDPREVYIVEPPSSKQVATSKTARFHANDYAALQLVLSNLEGVKQADSPRDSVGAVFVHVHKADELGRFPGKLAELEKFRTRDDVAVYVYGETETGKVVFKRVWRSGAAITFTPSALKRDSSRLVPLIEEWATSRESTLGDRERFPWIPLQYLLPGGAFGPGVDEQGKALPPAPKEDLDKRTARLNLYTLLSLEHLSLVQVAPTLNSPPNPLAAFPRISDRMPLATSAWEQVMEWFPCKYRDLSVAQLQDLVCKWRVRYPQLRRWVIIATPEELELYPASPGIDFVTIDQAEELLSRSS